LQGVLNEIAIVERIKKEGYPNQRWHSKGSDEVWDDDGVEVEKNLLLEKFSQRGR
jgi:hypothetical protein